MHRTHKLTLGYSLGRIPLGLGIAISIVGAACSTGLDLGGNNSQTNNASDAGNDGSASSRDGGAVDGSSDGPPTTLRDAGDALVLATTNGTSALVVSAGYVYWNDGPLVDRVAIGKPGAGTLFVDPPHSGGLIYALAVDATYVYSWTTDDGTSLSGNLRRTDLTTDITTDVNDGQYPSPQALASDGTTLFAGYTTQYQSDSLGNLEAIPGDIYAASGDTMNPLFADAGDCEGLILQGALLVFNHSGGSVSTVAKNGTNLMTVGTKQGGEAFISGIAASDAGIFWAETTESTEVDGIYRAAAGGTPQTLSAAPAGGGSAAESSIPIAADDAFVYWGNGNALQRVAVGGGAVETIVTETGVVTAIAIDGDNIFWAFGNTEGDGAIKQMSKP